MICSAAFVSTSGTAAKQLYLSSFSSISHENDPTVLVTEQRKDAARKMNIFVWFFLPNVLLLHFHLNTSDPGQGNNFQTENSGPDFSLSCTSVNPLKSMHVLKTYTGINENWINLCEHSHTTHWKSKEKKNSITTNRADCSEIFLIF